MDSADKGPDAAAPARWPNRRRARRFIALGAVTAAVLAYGWLVWPTPYRYGRDADKVRVNRFTGKAQTYDKRKQEWKSARRGRGNSEGTSPYDGRGSHNGSGSPIGGSRSGGGGGGSRDNGWWWQDDKAEEKREARDDQWWYGEGDDTEKPASKGSGGSPIGGSRGNSEGGSRDASGGGSPIGGQ